MKWAESLTRPNWDPGNPAVVACALRPEALRPHLSMGLRLMRASLWSSAKIAQWRIAAEALGKYLAGEHQAPVQLPEERLCLAFTRISPATRRNRAHHHCDITGPSATGQFFGHYATVGWSTQGAVPRLVVQSQNPRQGVPHDERPVSTKCADPRSRMTSIDALRTQ